MKLTFLTNGRALVPYEISESTAAGEDEDVLCKASHSFIKKKKCPPCLGNYLLPPPKAKSNGSNSPGFTFRSLNLQATQRTYPFSHILKMTGKDA